MRPRALALTLAAGAASAVAAALLRLKRPGADGAPDARSIVDRLPRLRRAGGGRPARSVAAAVERLRHPGAGGARTGRSVETYRCECGEEFRVSGTGRHRVFWRAGAADGDPLLAERCPSCDRPLRPEPA